MSDPGAEHPQAAALPPELDEIERLATLMDSSLRIPLIGYRIGLDGLIGLFPVVGDAAALIPAGYIIYTARKLGAPNGLIARMVMNSGVDAVFGSVPLIGDLFDFAFKSNRRNVKLLRRHLERRHGLRELQRRSRPRP